MLGGIDGGAAGIAELLDEAAAGSTDPDGRSASRLPPDGRSGLALLRVPFGGVLRRSAIS
jgi:hypothetical protein